MTEKKGVRELERELANARAEQRAYHESKVTVNRDYSIGGVDKSTTVEKKIPDTADVPDAILLPKKKRLKKQSMKRWQNKCKKKQTLKQKIKLKKRLQK